MDSYLRRQRWLATLHAQVTLDIVVQILEGVAGQVGTPSRQQTGERARKGSLNDLMRAMATR